MKRVIEQIAIMQGLLDDLKEVTGDNRRSLWQRAAIPSRVDEATAIIESAKALRAIIRRASP